MSGWTAEGERCPRRGHWTRKTTVWLPKTGVYLPGAVVRQYRVYGERVYGPYYFRFWREGGRLRKAYVRRSEVETVRKACRAWKGQKVKSNRDNLRRFRADMNALFRVWDRIDAYGDHAPASASEVTRIARLPWYVNA